MMHFAYNLTTKEVISCPTGNQLKRAVRYRSRDGGKWVFAHGLNAIERLIKKVA